MESLEIINRQTKQAYNIAAQKYYDLFHDELDKKPFDKEFINRDQKLSPFLSYMYRREP